MKHYSYYSISRGAFTGFKTRYNIILIVVAVFLLVVGCGSIESKKYQSRVRAVKKIKDQSTLYKIAINDNNYFVKYEAMLNLKEDLLQEVCFNAVEPKASLMATKFINDQTRLIRITEDNKFWEARRSAFNKLKQESIESLLNKSDKEEVKAAIRIRLGKLTWNDLLIQSDGSKSSLDMLVGAVALVDAPIPPAELVVSLCHKYIRLGDISRIPELKFLLLNFGNKSLAEDYLNCGQSELRETGIQWGRQHGYPNVVTGNKGSNRVRWGESKKDTRR